MTKSLKTLTKKSLLYYLGFDDDKTWEKNKDMMGYKDGEKYEDFFYRTHGFEAHKLDDERKKENTPIYFYIGRLENEIENLKNTNIKLLDRIKQLEIKTDNMQKELVDRVPGYKIQSFAILRPS